MWKNFLIISILVVGAYFLGAETMKRRRKDYEDVRHQLERLWTSPDARKSRKRLAKNAAKTVDKAVSQAEHKLAKLTR